MLTASTANRWELEGEGYVLFGPSDSGASWITMAHPDRTCLRPMRGGKCGLDKGHHGRCSTVVFCCDGCGRYRRGFPHAKSHAPDETFVFCFLCVREAEETP